ncbi:MAG: hypothetical protein NZ585_08620 [Chloracidobacterium sp.]|nr:hypothetical protein [Chloracidobacterium sp.]MDW8217367.1 hypothetical protein [Acidobacteriota bacterium]
MTSLSLSLPQDLLDEQEALLARIARCREKLNLAIQRARAALSLEDTAEVFFTELVPWAQRGGAPVRSAPRPSSTRLTAATSRATEGLLPLPVEVAPPPADASPAPAPVAVVASAVAPTDEIAAFTFFQSIPWDTNGGGRSTQSPWSSAGASEFLRVATESAIRASQVKK